LIGFYCIKIVLIMPLKDPEKRKEYMKKWHLDHKEERKDYNSQRHQDNKEVNNSRSKQWREDHKEGYKDTVKKYRQSDAYKKSYRITNWKKYGILSDDYDALYDKFLNTEKCEECNCELVYGNFKNAKCLDHDHSTGLVRNVLCRSCNTKRG
jgi:hypothetical protein